MEIATVGYGEETYGTITLDDAQQLRYDGTRAQALRLLFQDLRKYQIPGQQTQSDVDVFHALPTRLRGLWWATFGNQVKFNPYHDTHTGRFTTGNAYSGFSALSADDQQRILVRMGGQGISLEGALARGRGTLEQAKTVLEIIWEKAAGTLSQDSIWYEKANTMVEGLSKKFGVADDVSAGVVAALSPRNAWDGVNKNGKVIFPNVKDAYIVMKAHTENIAVSISPELAAHMKGLDKKGLYTKGLDDIVGKSVNIRDMSPMLAGLALSPYMHSYPPNTAKALRIMRGESPDAVLGGPKVRSFFDNLVNPKGTDAVTVDTWMVRVLSGKEGSPQKLGSLLASPSGGKLKGIGSYPFFAEVIKRLAGEYGLTPAQAQAVIWSTSRRKA